MRFNFSLLMLSLLAIFERSHISCALIPIQKSFVQKIISRKEVPVGLQAQQSSQNRKIINQATKYRNIRREALIKLISLAKQNGLKESLNADFKTISDFLENTSPFQSEKPEFNESIMNVENSFNKKNLIDQVKDDIEILRNFNKLSERTKEYDKNRKRVLPSGESYIEPKINDYFKAAKPLIQNAGTGILTVGRTLFPGKIEYVADSEESDSKDKTLSRADKALEWAQKQSDNRKLAAGAVVGVGLATQTVRNIKNSLFAQSPQTQPLNKIATEAATSASTGTGWAESINAAAAGIKDRLVAPAATSTVTSPTKFNVAGGVGDSTADAMRNSMANDQANQAFWNSWQQNVKNANQPMPVANLTSSARFDTPTNFELNGATGLTSADAARNFIKQSSTPRPSLSQAVAQGKMSIHGQETNIALPAAAATSTPVPDESYWNSAANSLASMRDSAYQGASSAYQSAADTVGAAYNSASSTIANTYNSAAAGLQSTGQKVAENATWAKNGAINYAQSSYDYLNSGLSSAKDYISSEAQSAYDATSQYASEAYTQGSQYAGDAQKWLQESDAFKLAAENPYAAGALGAAAVVGTGIAAYKLYQYWSNYQRSFGHILGKLTWLNNRYPNLKVSYGPLMTQLEKTMTYFADPNATISDDAKNYLFANAYQAGNAALSFLEAAGKGKKNVPLNIRFKPDFLDEVLNSFWAYIDTRNADDLQNAYRNRQTLIALPSFVNVEESSEVETSLKNILAEAQKLATKYSTQGAQKNNVFTTRLKMSRLDYKKVADLLKFTTDQIPLHEVINNIRGFLEDEKLTQKIQARKKSGLFAKMLGLE